MQGGGLDQYLRQDRRTDEKGNSYLAAHHAQRGENMKHALRDRIYDQGVSQVSLPSIKRAHDKTSKSEFSTSQGRNTRSISPFIQGPATGYMASSSRELVLGKLKGSPARHLIQDDDPKMKAQRKAEDKKSRAQSGLRAPIDPSLEMTVSEISLDRSFQNLKQQILHEKQRKGLLREMSKNQLTDEESLQWWMHEQQLIQQRNLEHINKMIVREERQTPKKPMGVFIPSKVYSKREAPLFQEMDTQLIERPRGLYSEATHSITGLSTMSPLKPSLHKVPSYKQDMYSAKIAARRVKLPTLQREDGEDKSQSFIFSKRAYSHANIQDADHQMKRQRSVPPGGAFIHPRATKLLSYKSMPKGITQANMEQQKSRVLMEKLTGKLLDQEFPPTQRLPDSNQEIALPEQHRHKLLRDGRSVSNLSMSGLSTDNEPTQRGSPFQNYPSPFPAVVSASGMGQGGRHSQLQGDPFASRKKKSRKLDGLEYVTEVAKSLVKSESSLGNLQLYANQEHQRKSSQLTADHSSKKLTKMDSEILAELERGGPPVHMPVGTKVWTKLDKFIELLLTTDIPDQSVFLYLNPPIQHKFDPEKYDPYDLRICAFPHRNPEFYFTLSGKGLTTYKEERPVDYMKLGDWLIERDLFYTIRRLPFFRKFRRWKFLNMWHKNIVRESRKKAGKELSKKLFILDPIFRSHLLRHVSLCYDMEGLRFIEVSSNLQVQSLENFASAQQRQRSKVNEKVQQFSERCRDNVLGAIRETMDSLRRDIQKQMEDDENKQKTMKKLAVVNSGAVGLGDIDNVAPRTNTPGFPSQDGGGGFVSKGYPKNGPSPTSRAGTRIDKQKSNHNVFETLGFPDQLPYKPRADIRKTCQRFLKFSYLIDFLAQRSLGEIYKGSMGDLFSRFRQLNQERSFMHLDEEAKEQWETFKGLPSTKKLREKPKQEPFFKLSLMFDPGPLGNLRVPYNAIHKQEIEAFRFEDKNPSPVEDFCFDCHIETHPEPMEMSEQESQSGVDLIRKSSVGSYSYDTSRSANIFKKYIKRFVPGIQKYWLTLNPVCKTFIEVILQAVRDGLQNLNVFERWSRHDQLTPYASALQEWDDMVGDDWEEPDINYIDPKPCIRDEICYTARESIVSDLVTAAFQRASNSLNYLEPFLQIYWENMSFNFEKLTHLNLLHPSEYLHATIKLLKYQEKKLKGGVPMIMDEGLLRLDCGELRNQFTPLIQKCIKQIESKMPPAIHMELLNIKQFIIDATKQLSREAITVDDYVELMEILANVSVRHENERDKLDTYGQNYIILQENSINFNKNDRDLHQECMSMSVALSQLISNVEASQNANVSKFKMQLEKLIPQLNEGIATLAEAAQDPSLLEYTEKINNMLTKVLSLQSRYNQLESMAVRYNSYQEVLLMERTHFSKLEDVKENLDNIALMWNSLKQWQVLVRGWRDTSFGKLNAERISDEALKYAQICSRLEKNLPLNVVQAQLKKQVHVFRETMPVVTALRNPKLEQSHWKEIKHCIEQEVGAEAVADLDIQEEEFTLEDLLDLKVEKQKDQILQISLKATQEAELRTQIQRIQNEWKKIEFQLKEYKAGSSNKTVFILDDVQEINQALDDSMASVTLILASRFVAPLRQVAQNLRKDLMLTSTVMELWIQCQKMWLYLSNIFSGSEIKRQLSNESLTFDQVDRFYRGCQQRASGAQNVLRYLRRNGNQLQEQFKIHNATLEKIQKSLDEYLESKRRVFPRFYFLSNDELLELLAKSHNLEIVQQALKKCFDGIAQLDYSGEYNDIRGLISPQGEKLILAKTIKQRSNVEFWLEQLQNQMIETLKRDMRKGIDQVIELDLYSQTAPRQWLFSRNAQLVLTLSLITWTNFTEEYISQMSGISIMNSIDQSNSSKDVARGTTSPKQSIREVRQQVSTRKPNPMALYDWFDDNVRKLEGLTALVRSPDLTQIQRKVIVTLITADVHNRDMVSKLAEKATNSIQDFEWQQILRFYWDLSHEEAYIKQISAQINYGYEYIGATSRLVITPLTDRCWITITSALHIHLGASPAGPAGTGKTESTKDLAKGLGTQCVVFNCSEQIEYQMMERLMAGLAQQGSWACLDEFNRIDIEVLSVIAHQLMQIRMALVQRVSEFEFGNLGQIPLKSTCGVFVTMNPGYAGRTELPDNLKVLFRSVAMMIPDYALIAEIMLFAEGFDSAKSLSKKMVKLYKLASEQLSQQDHYDFGMRAVKSVLVMAGALKREATAHAALTKQVSRGNVRDSVASEPQANEQDLLLIRAMRDSNVPKFLREDIPLFMAIIKDLFPLAQIPDQDFGELQETVEEVMARKCFQIVPQFVRKAVQLFDTFNVRFGVMLVGPTGGGKSSIYEVLAESMSELRISKHSEDPNFQLVNTQVVNPKAISMGELYGEVNALSQEWKDGLVSGIMRAASTEKGEHRKWIVFDGPVDALWIENMNTVLDDNMTLCLANGQRIKLRPQMRILFEVQDLAVASPATVSRCGMVYVAKEDVGWKPFVYSWLQRREEWFNQMGIDEQLQKYLRDMFESGIQQGLSRIRGIADGVLQLPGHMQKSSTTSVIDDVTTEGGVSGVDHGTSKSELNEPIRSSDLQLVAGVCNILEAILSDRSTGGWGFPRGVHNVAEKRKILTSFFAFAYGWGLGGGLSEDSKEKFDYEIKEVFKNLSIPGGASFFDIYLDFPGLHDSVSKKGEGDRPVQTPELPQPVEKKSKANSPAPQKISNNSQTVSVSFKKWQRVVPLFSYQNDVPFFNLQVSTSDTVSYSHIIRLLLSKEKSMFITGVTGVGKTMLIEQVLSSLSIKAAQAQDKDPRTIGMPLELKLKKNIKLIQLNFSAQTSSLRTQQNIEANLDKKGRSLYGAPPSQKVAIFVDDANMPVVEEYGAQPPIELLRMFLDLRGFYDRQTNNWKSVEDTTLICAAAPPAGGRAELSARFMRHFNTLCIPRPSRANLTHIFTSIVSGFLMQNKFFEKIQQLADVIVFSTIQVYEKLSSTLLPTPARFHYLFNLRDISKVIQGLLQVRPVSVQSEEQMARLWMHECLRVFHDRLLVEDKPWFTRNLLEMAMRSLKVSYRHDQLFEREEVDEKIQNEEREETRPLIWSNLLRLDSPIVMYEEIRDFQKLKKVLATSQEEHNENIKYGKTSSSTKMELVFFDDAISHLARISRIISNPRGSAMLIGLGGSGKQSLTRLSSHLLRYSLKTVEITRKFGPEDFRQSLKEMTLIAGLERKPICFLLNDTQIINQSFLEDINNLLNTGEVPNLYEFEDRERIVNENREHATSLGLLDSPEIIFKAFIQNVRDYLHIVVCMSPVGGALRVRCRRFPSLINCCTIDWFSQWKRSALQYVAEEFLVDPVSELPGGGWVSSKFQATMSRQPTIQEEKKMPSSGLMLALEAAKVKKEEVKEKTLSSFRGINIKQELIHLCIRIHTDVRNAALKFDAEMRRKVYITPKSYLDLMGLYKSLLREKRRELGGEREHLQNGVKKLEETNLRIGELQVTLNNLKPKLVQKQEQVEKAIVKIKEDKAIAYQKEREVIKDKEHVNQQTVEANRIAKEAEHELSKAKPELDQARVLVNNLDPNTIFEIRSFKNPPKDVLMVMESVMLLLNEKSGWEGIRQAIKESSAFVEKLKKFDVSAAAQSVWDKLEKNYIGKPEFNPQYLLKKSVAASKMCSWVRALYKYSKVLKKVLPMKARCRELQQARDQKQRLLKGLEDELFVITRGIKDLEVALKAMKQEQDRLQEEERVTGQRLQRAEKLLKLLQDEGVRWAATASDISSRIELLVGDVFLSAAQVAYLGPFTGQFRQNLIESWVEECEQRQIPLSFGKAAIKGEENGSEKEESLTVFSLRKVLGDPVAIRDWVIKGLPNDAVSIDNGVMARKANKWPLMIDPQIQAFKWIKNLEQGLQAQGLGKGIVLLKASGNITPELSMAVRQGVPVLLSDCGETLDPVLDPLLNKEIIITNPDSATPLKQIRLADQLLEYQDSSFALYMTTKLANPHYLPEVAVKVSLINFTVTFQGLEDQLLGDVVKNERPEIEERRDELILRMDQDAKLLKSLEARILKLMADSTSEQILDDDSLISALQQSKKKSREITQNLQQNLRIERQINQTRNKYRAAATRGSVVYFVIADLSKIESMYEYSLQYVKRMFNTALVRSAPQQTQGERIRELVNNVTEQLFTNVCRGLFQEHKILFSFLLLTSIYRLEEPIDYGKMYKEEYAVVEEEKRKQEEIRENLRQKALSQSANASRRMSMASVSPHAVSEDIMLDASMFRKMSDVIPEESMRNSKEKNPSQGKAPSEKNQPVEEIKADVAEETPSQVSVSEYSEPVEITPESRARHLRRPFPQSFIESNFKITSHIWEVFIRGYKSKAVSEEWRSNPFVKGVVPAYTMTNSNWFTLSYLAQKPKLFGQNWKLLLQQLDPQNKESFEEWKAWLQLDQPSTLPNGWNSKKEGYKYLSTFESFFLVKLLRPQKFWTTMYDFVKQQMGTFFIQAPNPSFENVLEDIDNKTPLIFVLSQGAEPTSSILKYVSEKGLSNKFTVTSLGQGQGTRAGALINQAAQEGNWVLLQNCHLAQSWMPVLEERIEELVEDARLGKVHKDFKLFLTSMPVDYFPISVLQNGLKLSTEAPRGIKNNLKRSYASITAEELYSATPKEVSYQWHKLLFGLSFFHAVVQERRKFGALGWNIRYEFNESDWQTSKKMLQLFLTESFSQYRIFHQFSSEKASRKMQPTSKSREGLRRASLSLLTIPLPWDALQFVTGHINYGGRVTDDLDRRCLLATLRKFYNPGVLESTYKFEASGVYKVPSLGSLDSYKEYIESLPLNDENLELFGLHANANIAHEFNESRRAFDILLEVQPRSSAAEDTKTKQDFKRMKAQSGGDPEENARLRLKGEDLIVCEAVEGLMSRLPPQINPFSGQAKRELFKPKKDQKIGDTIILESLTTVLLQEIERYNKLTEGIKSSLVSMRKAILGLIVMSADLDQMFLDVLNNKVPQLWSKGSYPSLKPLGSWFNELLERLEFLVRWLTQGEPAAFWLGGFFFPQGFLTGTLQRHARLYKIPIDKLSFKFQVYSGAYDLKGQTAESLAQNGEEIIDEGILVYGLYLQSAMWNGEKDSLEDQTPGSMYERMPLIHFQPEEDHKPDPMLYECPVYKTAARAGILSTTGQSTNYILSVELPTLEESPEFWTLRGTALLCALSV